MSFTDSDNTQGFKLLGERPVKGAAPPSDVPADDSGFKLLDERPALNDPGAVQSLIALGRKRAMEADADIDYKSGAPWDVRAQIQGAANPNEIYKILDRRYGKGNFGQDRNGQWWVNETVAAPAPVDRSKLPSRLEFGGIAPIMGPREPTSTERRRVAVMPSGAVGGLKSFLSGTVSSPWATAGGILGGAVGSPAGLPGMVGGAAAGATIGAALDRFQKWAFSTFDQKPAEAVAGVASEGLAAGIATMLGPAASKVGRGIQKGIQRFYGTREKGKITEPARMGRELGLGGDPRTRPSAIPPVGSYAPEATSPRAKQELRDYLMGKGGTHAERMNAIYLDSRMIGALQEAGYSPAEIAKIRGDADSVRSAQLSTREAGRELTKVASGELGGHMDLAERERQGARLLLDREIQMVDQLANAPDSLAQNVADAIVLARARFGRAMSESYKALDREFAGQKLVPTEDIQLAAQHLVSTLPPSAVPPQIVRWARGFFTSTADDIETRITTENAHAVRSLAREKGAFQDIAGSGLSGHNWRTLAAAADAALGKTEGDLGTYYATKLRSLDTQYKEGIRKFEQREINQLVQQVKAGILPVPEKVAGIIMKGDYVNLAEQVKSIMPNAVWQRVLQADLRTMLDAATRMDKSGMMTLDGAAFLRVMHDRADLLSRTYPPSWIGGLRQMAASLAAYDGQIDVRALQGMADPLGVIKKLETAVAAAQAADRFATRHPLGALASGDPVKVDAAVRAITRAGAEETTVEAFKILENHPEARDQLRKAFITRVFANAVMETPSMQKVIAGDAIDRTLRGLTPRQQELLFPGGLADDLRLLAKEARFLFPKSADDIAKSLAGRAIQLKMPRPMALLHYGMARMAGWIYDNPRVLKFLTNELKDNPQRGRLIARALIARELARGFSGPPKGKPDQQLMRPENLKGLQPGQQNGRSGQPMESTIP